MGIPDWYKVHRPCVPHHVRMDMFRNFLTNRLCHAPILRKECCYRIGRHLFAASHGSRYRTTVLTVVILCWDGIVQILFAVLDCSVQQRHCTGFSSLTMQVRNWMFCVKTQVTDLHIEKLTASGSGIAHEDHEYKIPLVFLHWKDWAVEAARSTPVRSGIQRFAREPPWGILQAERYNDVCVQSICPAKSRKDRNAIKRWLRVETLHPRAFSSQVRKLRMTSRSTREKVSSAAPIPISSLI